MTMEHLEAENRELRRLWIENEGDIIELRCMLDRYFHLKWYKRLFIKWGDKRLWKDNLGVSDE
jgi:hypothetical protein